MIKSIKNILKSNANLTKKIIQLQQNRAIFESYSSLQNMFFCIDENTWESDPNLKKFWGMFSSTLKEFMTAFRKMDIFSSASYLAEFYFSALKDHSLSDQALIDQVVDCMHINGLTSSSLVIFPVHSFGIDDIGLNLKLKNSHIHYESNDILLFPQQNRVERAKACIEIAKESFKMKSIKFDNNLLDHYLRSRPLKWFECNQLMFCKVNFSSANYYENEYYLIRCLEKSVSKMFLAFNIITNKKLLLGSKGFSTRVVNNWQTTDIHHYLVFTKVKGKLIPECIPIHSELSNLVELSKINIDMPVSLNTDVRLEIDKLNKFVDYIYRNCIEGLKTDNRWYFYDKLRRSLIFFVRSYQSRYKEDSIIYLCIAFEMIYCDGLKNNIGQLLCTNISSILPPNAVEIFRNIGDLYNSRSGVAHEGVPRECNLEKCRKIYMDAFVNLSILVRKNEIDVNTKKAFTAYTEKYFKEKAGFCPFNAS